MVADRPPDGLAVAYVALTAAYGPLWVAADEGLFAGHGLDVTLRRFTPAAGVQALVAGEVDLYAGGTAALAAAVAGAPIAYVASIVDRFVMSLFVEPGVGRVDDLSGRTVGVTQPGTPTDAGARLVLMNAGLVPGRDVKLVYLDGGARVLAALRERTIHAGMLSPPLTAAARSAGLRELVAPGALAERFPQTALVARRRDLDARREALVRFLRAYVDGVTRARAHPERAREIIARYTEVADPGATAENYAAFSPWWEVPPRVTEAGIRAALAVLTVAGTHPVEPAAVLDTRIVDAWVARTAAE
jgi:ABC-type nitrate/sulfonate/bicarbonate transport system substrate-binding protein